MPNHVAVNSRDHRELRVREERLDTMGDGVMGCITFPEEFRNLQNHYPILLQLNAARDKFTCMAVFGFENGENLYLNDGKWDARYVPIAMDVQPFIIGKNPGDNEEKKVVIDMDSPRLGEGEGQRVFDDHGVATTYLENISRKLAYLDDGYQKSDAYIECLKKYDLLEPLSIDVTLKDGSKNRLMGFHTIHEERFRALEDKALGVFQKKGYLMPTFMMLASLSNLANLIQRKNDLIVNV